PIQVNVYDSKVFTHTSTCSPCTCGAPAGSKCSTSISIYYDKSDCTGAGQKLTVENTQPVWCQSVPPGTGLLSKMADQPSYTPGTCAAMGGVLSGDATPDETSLYT